jgi:8-amino-7-oxononanoate synthase
MLALDAALVARLQQRKQCNLYRQRTIAYGCPKPSIEIGGKTFLSFASNDYLGLASHPQVIAAARRGLDKYAVGSGAAHLLGGYSHAHAALEEELAEFLGFERALLFSTGYMANLGVITALCGRGDYLFVDRLSHASIMDGACYCGAHFKRYRHCDMSALNAVLNAVPGKARHRLIVSDALFSMDGDVAPLSELAAIARRQQCWLMIDDAHGMGILGDHGRGSLNHCGVLPQQDVQVLVGTFGKAFGTFGAFVAGSKNLIEALIQFARPYIYTTASPAMLAEATRASLAILRGAEGEERRAHLQNLIRVFRGGAVQLGLPIAGEPLTPIQTLVIGEVLRARQVAERLQEHGIKVALALPPTVPSGTARLRITLTANHNVAQIYYLLERLAACLC